MASAPTHSHLESLYDISPKFTLPAAGHVALRNIKGDLSRMRPVITATEQPQKPCFSAMVYSDHRWHREQKIFISQVRTFFGLCARSLVMIRQNGWNGQITVTFRLHFKKKKQTASSSLSHFLSILSLVRHHESYCTSVGFSVKPTHFLKYRCWKCLTESVA